MNALWVAAAAIDVAIVVIRLMLFCFTAFLLDD
jgi:hypothetical protein